MKNKSTEEYLLAPHSPFTMEAVHSNMREKVVESLTFNQRRKKRPDQKEAQLSPNKQPSWYRDIIISFFFFFF